MWLFGAGGRGADLLSLQIATNALERRAWSDVPTEGEDFYAVVHDASYFAQSESSTIQLDVRPATVTIQDDSAAHASAETAQPAAGCVEGCVLRGVLAAGGRQVYAVPAREDFGFFFASLRTGSSDVLVSAGEQSPGDHLLRTTQPLSRPAILPDAFKTPPYLFTVTNSSATPQPYSISLRWKPYVPGQDPLP
jgi:hypothetical protein